MGALAATHRPSSSPLEHAVLRIRAALTSLGHHECHILTHDAALLDEVVCTLERLAATVQARLSCPLSLLGMLPNTCRARVLLPEAVLRAMSRANYFIRPTLLAYRHREDWEKQIRRSAAVVAFYCGEHAPAGCFAQPSLRVASFFHALDKNRHMPALWLPTGGHCAGGPNAADDTDGACVLFAQLPRPCKVLCLQFLSNLPHVAFELIYQFPTIASVLVEGSDATKVHIPTMCWTRTFVDMGRSLDLAEYACGPRGPLYFGTLKFPLRAVYHITRFLGSALLQGAASTSVHKRSIGNVISLLRFRGMSFDDVRKAELKANSIFRPILESYRRNDDWQERVQISTNLLKYYCDGECLFPDLNMRVERFLPRIPLEPRNTA
eukprot:GEMP01053832.1.p1 GENE.GEMP01053832.1~~GEMP01053832.1.p1  ORF type:complete len:380 (+),score=90.37 GEMP01053832.1:92-1231(+)